MGDRIVITVLGLFVILLGSTSVAYGQPTLYGTDGGGNNPSTLYTIDTSTGAATAVGPTGLTACGALDFHPTTGVLYGICTFSGLKQLVTIDTITGIATPVGGPTGPEGDARFDISFRSDGTLFAVGFGPICVDLGTIDITTGLLSDIGTTGTCNPGNGIAFDSSDVLYHTDILHVLNILNTATGLATFQTSITDFFSGERINAMDFEPTSGVLFGSLNFGFGGSGPNNLVTLDTTTGVITVIGTSVNGLDGLAFEFQSALETEKFYTETDKDIEDGFFGTVLPFKNGIVDTGNPTQVVKAVVDRNGNIKSYNPGQYYAVTKVTALQDLDEVWIVEDDNLCTDVEQPISKMNPKKVPGGAYVALMCPDGTSVDLSSELAHSDPPRLFINAEGNVEAHVEDVPEGCMVFLGVKYSPGLKGENVQSIDQLWCENWELVTATNVAGEEFSDSAHRVLEVILPNDD